MTHLTSMTSRGSVSKRTPDLFTELPTVYPSVSQVKYCVMVFALVWVWSGTHEQWLQCCRLSLSFGHTTFSEMTSKLLSSKVCCSRFKDNCHLSGKYTYFFMRISLWETPWKSFWSLKIKKFEYWVGQNYVRNCFLQSGIPWHIFIFIWLVSCISLIRYLIMSRQWHGFI